MDATGLMAEINKIPPVTRFLSGSSLITTLSVALGVISPYWFFYAWNLVSGSLQVWRIVTTFFVEPRPGLNFLFELAMLYRTSYSLETQEYNRRSADYAWHLVLAAAGILALNHPLGSLVHRRPLIFALISLSSKISPDMPISLYGIVTLSAKWWPYLMLGADFIMGSSSSFLHSLTGVIIGHAWWLLVWRDPTARDPSWTRAPEWLKRLIPPPPLRPGESGHQPSGFGATNGATTPVTRYRWGPGQRLGNR